MVSMIGAAAQGATEMEVRHSSVTRDEFSTLSWVQPGVGKLAVVRILIITPGAGDELG